MKSTVNYLQQLSLDGKTWIKKADFIDTIVEADEIDDHIELLTANVTDMLDGFQLSYSVDRSEQAVRIELDMDENNRIIQKAE